ncbi:MULTISPECIES: allophanate hydrolase [unclassified Polaromonas]|uniref:allophanate hydrolase n=1 Tax=unclassified Polaromonas TaxID=2638319 RepID=UPI0018C91816|nr:MULTISPECIES: allophanate hydrolase [unclassified Polaromonas]MBG6073356.1 allophanate hydrolase [Polaromonas sp. CG_9.7]MBG6115304.1 allophanate hydrolase [Polaromonas sp. CG_9.2]MDH6182992.1 allophanate hydrolase [Polaromonas sp. CG_23.6]
MRLDLSIPALRARYLDGSLTPAQLVEQLDAQMRAEDAALDRHVWIRRLTLDEMRAHAAALDGRDPKTLPLYGIPFAIKDNIDLAGIPTTAACPAFAYTPQASATVVQRLIKAGAIPVGKTNLDQFATGLVGVRSPYGACRNSLNPDYVSGGSSAGSAVSVALGLASFSLGTDTAGSGRVPAMFNNLVGLKPTCGRIPATGVVPACRTLDVVSVFALTAGDAATVLGVAQGEDPLDAYSRDLPPYGHDFGAASSFRFGVPRPADLEFHGNPDGPAQFAQAVAHLQALGGTPVEVDLTPFRAVATLLYEGPWVAERYQAIRSFIEAQPEALHPVTRAITEKGAQISAPETFAALYRLKELQRQTRPVWQDIDCLVTPTASTIYTIDAVQADPIRLNSNLGHYTNYVNLLDLAAVAVPTGFMSDAMAGMPWGVTLVAPAGQDLPLLSLAARLHARTVSTVGAMPHAPHCLASALPDGLQFASGLVRVAVCGAHLSGLPLNGQLTQRGARLVREVRSAPCYKLFALPGGPPQRPGMLRVDAGGSAIEMEVWELPASEFGSFVAGIPAPLGIGTVALEDGSPVQGFVCEAHAAAQGQDITHFGGWRRYLGSLA